MKRRAFTLVEIMIVVMIIGILITIAIPQFLKARSRSNQKTCLSNLRQIDNAKEMWSMEFKAAAGDTVATSDLFPNFIRGSSLPDCPAGGTYDLEVVGTAPTCNAVDPDYPHVLN